MTKRMLIAISAICLFVGVVQVEADLAEEFVTPPDSAKPWVHMWWFGTITEADITQHLEELKDKGIGGFLLFDLGGMPDAPYISDNWRELFRYAVKEADRLGLKVATNICAGWPSGGTWITSEDGSKMVVSSETMITGPQKFSGKLVEPQGKDEPYMDVAVQAFPVSAESSKSKPVITVSSNLEDLPGILDGHFMTVWHSGAEGEQWILFDFGKPRVVDWAWIDTTGKISIEASSDGVNFKAVTTLNIPSLNTYYGAIPSTKACWFRIVVPGDTTVRDISLGTQAEVERFTRLAVKRGITHPLGITATRQIDQVRLAREDLVSLPDDHPLRIDKRIDLTDKLSDDGILNWDVPPGTWKVVRIGCTGTGSRVGGGFLTDYLSSAASKKNYEKGMKPLIDDVGALAGKTYQYLHEDNVEIPVFYSWTPKMVDEFQKRRGYDPTPYLSAMAGEIVENAEITDRFLADVRRTIADCVADEHYGCWAKLAHADDMKVRAEAGGQHHPRLLCNDGLMNQGRMDIPFGEFWENDFWKENQWTPANHHGKTPAGWEEGAQNVNVKQAASAAHLYGKPIIGAEAFTSFGPRAQWGVAPSDLLLYANITFCEGVNFFNIHGSATSGPEDGKPGKQFEAGTQFNHNLTWWNQGAESFLQYLTRCDYMLQQGLFVADVLYYNGDEAPNFVPPKNIDPSRGFGYDYDVCNTEILLTRLSVKDGRIVLPDGMSYRVLVLPDRPVIPLKVARKIEELVAAGATVIGPKPQRTPGLTGYPHSEQQLKEIADRVWGTEKVSQHSFGKGNIIVGASIREVLQTAGVSPDFAFQSDMEDAMLDFIHRCSDDADIYFVTNRRADALNAECTFRVSDKQPELWNPVTGQQKDLPQFESKDGCTSIPLEFGPYGSMFIVFRKPVASSPGGTNFVTLKPVQGLTGPWTVQFDPQWFYPTDGLRGDQAKGMFVFDKLEDWTKRPETAIKYFSGTAIYRMAFNATPQEGKRSYLDLGVVKNTARVRLNGKDLGVAWCSPWRVEITEAVKTGENTLEIDMVNLWRNRLIGDSKLPAEQRRTKNKYGTGGHSELLSSGLLGPVMIQAECIQ